MSRFDRWLFQKACLRWGSAYLVQEIESDFPHLGLIRSGYVTACLGFLRSLPESDRALYAQALVKRGKPREWLDGLGFPLDADEARALERFGNEAPRTQGAIKENSHDVKAVRTAIEAIFVGPLGPPTRREKGFFEFTSNGPAGAVLITLVDFGGKFGDLTYQHTVTDGTAPLHDFPLSILAWCGLSSVTRMSGISNDSAAAMVKDLLVIVEDFRRHLPTLLEASIVR